MSRTKVKKIPQRLCLGCNEMKDKRDLIRVVRSKEGEIFLDLTGRRSGRGAYICRSIDCLKAARKAKRIERAFSCAISDEIYDGMERELENEHS
ncbi:MAG: YlxR family protein [Ruminococcus sp.]|nr:YlxR family protein [Ruminococcus sp.]